MPEEESLQSIFGYLINPKGIHPSAFDQPLGLHGSERKVRCPTKNPILLINNFSSVHFSVAENVDNRFIPMTESHRKRVVLMAVIVNTYLNSSTLSRPADLAL